MDKNTRNSKRKDPPTESTETTVSKRAKPNRTLRSGEGKKKDHSNEYIPEQRYWIRLHFYMVNYAVSNRPCTAPSGTVSCAFFNAYWQGFTEETNAKRNEEPRTEFPVRTFRDFDDMRRSLVADDILGSITTESSKKEGEDPFRPVITPANLAEFREIYERNGDEDGFDFGNAAGLAELNEFLERLVNEQLAPENPIEPKWVTKGRENVQSRPLQNSYHKDERWLWYSDNSQTRDPKDFLRAFNPATGRTESYRLAYRRLHAGAGNALLHMAVMRPDGYDGDLNSLIDVPADADLSAMSEDQRNEFDIHMGAAFVGKHLKKEVESQSGWGDEAAADEAAKAAKATKTAEAAATDEVAEGEVDISSEE